MLGLVRAAAALRPCAARSKAQIWLKQISRGALSQSRTISSSSPRSFSPILSRVSRSEGAFSKSNFFTPSTIRTSTVATTADASAASSETTTDALPILPSKGVGIWLMVSSTLVFAIILVGGVTRLTESGLSITEWQPITGILPPLTDAQWEDEFTKYKATPEFKLLNHSISVSDFKRIFYMEWGHRVLGRVLGLAFVGPLLYFSMRKQLSRQMSRRLLGLGLLIGAQGALGWYMVKSGLDESLMDTPGAVPRVSQYRLASHLGLAFLLYAGMFASGMNAIKEWKWAVKGGNWMGFAKEAQFAQVLNAVPVRRFKQIAQVLTGLVFLTALSGAFVAGLDAGLLYNEFPLMGGRIVPPSDELMAPVYAKNADKSDLWWRNILENPTTVQFDHRVLATTTYTAIGSLWAATKLSPTLKSVLPHAVKRATAVAFAMANIQLGLGISTLLYLVPVPLAAAHQAGSVLLLSAMIHVLVTLRRPGMAARAWREALHNVKRKV